MSPPLVDVSDLRVALRAAGDYREVVRGIDFQIRRGEIVGLVGESGSGKSVTARTLMRLLPSDAKVSGSVEFDGRDVLRLSRRDLTAFRRRHAGMIFQDPRASMDPLYTVRSLLVEGISRGVDMSRRDAHAAAMSALADTGISDPDRVMAARPGELSGGLLQRVAIASVLARQPDLLIADEPTTALDVTIQAEVAALIKDLCLERNIAVLFITHDLALASALCQRTIVLYAGRVMECQPTASLFSQPLHPYTVGLIQARPAIGRRHHRLEAIPGRPPDPSAMPEGCAFHPRCSLAQDDCRTTVPELAVVGAPDRRSACLHVEELARGGPNAVRVEVTDG